MMKMMMMVTKWMMMKSFRLMTVRLIRMMMCDDENGDDGLC